MSKGFTLVELIIVIAIICLLSLIVVQAVGGCTDTCTTEKQSEKNIPKVGCYKINDKEICSQS